MAGCLIGIIGGSGLGDVLGQYIKNSESVEVQTPYGQPSGKILVGTIEGKQIAFINRHGDGHKHSPTTVPYAANIWALKKLGVRTVISSAAVGSLREEIAPRQLAIVDQIIDKTYKRDNSFFTGICAVHAEMAQPFCGRMRQKLIDAAQGIGIRTHSKATYVCMEGPSFSTRAESLMHRIWGGDLIGMTAMPEAKLAREAQLCYCLIAFISDYDCWRPQEAHVDKHALLKEIYGNLTVATENAIKLIHAVLSSDTQICSEDCACRKSLEVAQWTAKDKISAADQEKIAVLFE